MSTPDFYDLDTLAFGLTGHRPEQCEHVLVAQRMQPGHKKIKSLISFVLCFCGVLSWLHLGHPWRNQTIKQIILICYRNGGAEYWVPTNPLDRAAEDLALVYKLRWESENFFGWWKQHLKVYHRIARSKYGFTMHILAGLITYLLLAIYGRNHLQEKVSIRWVRELRIKIHNEAWGLAILS